MGDFQDRFAIRVDDYIRYRQQYPIQLVVFLQHACGLTADWVVADVGSGTGMLAEVFLKNGNRVVGVEPSPEMRALSEKQMCRYPGFRTVNGSAEHTTLPGECVDLVGIGRAIHWFDLGPAANELRRVLRPTGWLAVVRLRRRRSAGFMSAFEELLREYGNDYAGQSLRRSRLERRLEFCGLQVYRQGLGSEMDCESLLGFTRSLAVTPRPEEHRHETMMESLRSTFERFEKDGKITFLYDLSVHYGCRERIDWSGMV